MKCQDCELLLEEYLDGETDERAAGAIAAHLKTCAACSAAYDGLAAEQSLYASYEREVEVTPALWVGVEARLRAESREAGGKVGFLRRLSGWFAPLLVAPRFSPALTAAMVVVAIIGTAVVMKNVGGGNTKPPELAHAGNQGDDAKPAANASQSPAPTQAPSSTQTPSPASATPSPAKAAPQPDPGRQELAIKRPKQGVVLDKTPPGSRPPLETAADKLVREAEQRYVAAIKILERDVKTRSGKLDPETRARFDETLASIDRTIAETRKTARQHGNDPVAVQYMLSAYAKKVEVMREMATLGQAD
ncbi:MAG TPA: zf-HC2 domain-containing protein [Pyrinomonadaceae bacterium]